VRETDGISCDLHLNQDQKDIVVEVSKGELHFDHTEQGLIIYVPRDERLATLCFLDRLPQALLEWIMTDPVTPDCGAFSEKALRVLSTVLQAEPEYVGLILDRAGIMCAERPDEERDYANGVVGTTGDDSGGKQKARGLIDDTSLRDAANQLEAIRLS
jgi:hypothetical protein